ncbi:MAG: 5-formyltetrahydrofolate cyclo-ligase [Chthoniobacteraceae bacterium]
MTSKEELRESLRERLRALPSEEIAWKSYMICDHIQRMPVWKEAKVVGLFASLPTEPVMEFLWDDLRENRKKVCYPKVNGETLSLILVNDPTELVVSRWQLREPVMREPNLQAIDKIDLLLVPGLAFSTCGARLGRGGGFYDRLLARESLRAHKLGVCFDMQTFSKLPVESHDIAVDAVVTESGILPRTAPSSSRSASI